jgi:SEC-C motif domain protein
LPLSITKNNSLGTGIRHPTNNKSTLAFSAEGAVAMELCPCGSLVSFDLCCNPCITGTAPALTAEQQMRARYSAYVKVNTDYIFNSTHPEHRTDYDHKGTEEWAKGAQWLGLEILATTGGAPEDSEGSVEFIAHFREKGQERHHHELGHFLKDDGKWYFTEGTMITNRPIVRTSPKIGRNDPCPCGSTLKFKKCCGK